LPAQVDSRAHDAAAAAAEGEARLRHVTVALEARLEDAEG